VCHVKHTHFAPQINKEKYPLPENWNYEGARLLFNEPDVTPAEDVNVNFGEPDVEGIVQFLCVEKGFGEERGRSAIAKMQTSKSTSVQNRLTSYFGAPVKVCLKKSFSVVFCIY
jgi:flap endonuclease-1